ncbi:hypothetical protein H924_12790 [Corynebacterium callunae DSM 20147]|uniref:Uncharacterized protein n=1 Tax=Corynebacterium callunae DSM 20147 TaxID=1121353 RepID=M1UWE5_9CORY|nr:hypothetical protein H924_12790 [Corynebacterium callunae DSM 20147]
MTVFLMSGIWFIMVLELSEGLDYSLQSPLVSVPKVESPPIALGCGMMSKLLPGRKLQILYILREQKWEFN